MGVVKGVGDVRLGAGGGVHGRWQRGVDMRQGDEVGIREGRSI